MWAVEATVAFQGSHTFCPAEKGIERARALSSIERAGQSIAIWQQPVSRTCHPCCGMQSHLPQHPTWLPTSG